MSLPRPAIVLLASLGASLATPGGSGAYTVSANFTGVVTDGSTVNYTYDFEEDQTTYDFRDLIGRTAYLSISVEIIPEWGDDIYTYPASFSIFIEGAYGFGSNEAWGSYHNSAPGQGGDSIDAIGFMYAGRYSTEVRGHLSLSDPTGTFFDSLDRQTTSGPWEGKLQISFSGGGFWFDSLGNGGYSEYAGQQLTPVPEPGTLGLAASACLCGLSVVARRRRRA